MNRHVDGPPVNFPLSPASVIRSVPQRWLLAQWQRVRRDRLVPLWSDWADIDLGSDGDDISVFAVEAAASGMTFRLEKTSSLMARAYGRTDCAGSFLHDILPAEARAVQLQPYEQTVRRRAPVYTITDMRDAAARPVTFERLLLPFADAEGAVTRIIASFQLLSIEGSFQDVNILRAPGAMAGFRVRCMIASPPRPSS
jgi:hypothetical protein